MYVVDFSHTSSRNLPVFAHTTSLIKIKSQFHLSAMATVVKDNLQRIKRINPEKNG